MIAERCRPGRGGPAGADIPSQGRKGFPGLVSFHGWRRWSLAYPKAIAVLLVVMLPLVGLSQVSAHPRSNLEIDLNHQDLAADTYVLTVEAPGDFHVTGDESVGISFSATFDEPRQDAGLLMGVVRGWDDKDCQPSPQDDPCFFRYRTESLKDATDVTLQPTKDVPRFKVDEDQDAIVGVSDLLAWNGKVHFEHETRDGDLPATFRLIVSVPTADTLDIDVHLHANRSLTYTETWFDGGFFLTGEDMRPAVHVDTVAGGTASYGAKLVHVPGGQRTYAAMGPGNHGEVQVPNPLTGNECHTCPETYPTAGGGSWGMFYPNGNSQAVVVGAGVATPGQAITIQSLIRVLGSAQHGAFEFWTNEYVMGPHNDIYVIGFHGPLD